MSEKKRKHNSSPSSKKIKDTELKGMSQIEYTNQIIAELHKKNFKEGIKYIELHNLEFWLEDQLDLSTEYNMEIEEMYSIFYENNIDKKQNSINVNPVIPPIVAPSSEMVVQSSEMVSSSIQSKHGGNKTIKKQNKLVLYKGGVGPYFKDTFNTLTVLSIKDTHGNEVCKVYGSSLPENKKIPELYKYFKKIGVNIVISLQNCEKTLDGVHKSSCRKLGYNKLLAFEPSKIWKEMGKKFIRIRQKGKTRRIKKEVETTQFLTPEIKDMTAGTIPAFDKLSSVEIWKYPTLIHCYAGFGRTGSVLLYYWFRSHLLYKCDGKGYEVLNQPFIGLNGVTSFINSATMYMYLMNNFKKNISKYSDPVWDAEFAGNTYSTDSLTHELFKSEKLNSVNLFITRINYILLYSALFVNAQTDPSLPGIPALNGYPITEIFLYPLHDNYPNFAQKFSKGHIFKTPVLTDIHTFDANNPFGLKLEIPQHIFDSSDSSS